MIIFYNKSDGAIIGEIDGRIHTKDQLNMWIGDKNETERLIIEWVPMEWKNNIPTKFKPDHPQKDIIRETDKTSKKIYNFKVDPKTKKLIKINQKT